MVIKNNNNYQKKAKIVRKSPKKAKKILPTFRLDSLVLAIMTEYYLQIKVHTVVP